MTLTCSHWHIVLAGQGVLPADNSAAQLQGLFTVYDAYGDV
jgi:hypothetical protein